MFDIATRALGSEKRVTAMLRAVLLTCAFIVLILGNTIINRVHIVGVDGVAVNAYVDSVSSDRESTWLVINYMVDGRSHDTVIEQDSSRMLRDVQPGDQIPLVVNRADTTAFYVDSGELQNRARLLVFLGIMLVIAGMMPTENLRAMLDPDDEARH